MKTLIAASLLLATPLTVHAQQQVQELFRTELVYPQEKGEIQLTAGATGLGAARSADLPMAVEYGLSDAWQLSVEWRATAGRPANRGAQEVTFGTKYGFMNLAGRTIHAAVGFEVEIPRGAAAGGEIVRYTPTVALAMDLPAIHDAQVFGAVSVAWAGPADRGSEAEGAVPYVSGGAMLPFSRLALAAELTLEREDEQSHAFVTPSIVLNVSRALQLAVGTPIRLHSAGDRLALSALLTYEPGR
jgi:hypothetical protein